MSRPAFLDRPHDWTRTPREQADPVRYADPLIIETGVDGASRWLLAGLAFAVGIFALAAWAADMFPH